MRWDFDLYMIGVGFYFFVWGFYGLTVGETPGGTRGKPHTIYGRKAKLISFLYMIGSIAWLANTFVFLKLHSIWLYTILITSGGVAFSFGLIASTTDGMAKRINRNEYYQGY